MGLDGVDDLAGRGEESIVRTSPPGEIPGSFDSVEFICSRRELVTVEVVRMLLSLSWVQKEIKKKY